MAHQIETMFYAGQAPWHKLGTYVGEQPVLSEDAIRAADLDWSVEKKKLYFQSAAGAFVEVPTNQVIVRSKDEKQFAVVGRGYVPFQNRDAFKFLDGLVTSGQMRYHTAGALRGGAWVWCLAQLEGVIEPLPGDVTHPFMLLAFGHDGTMGVRGLPTSVRVVCANTLRAAFSEGVGEGFSYFHGRNLHAQMEKAQRTFLATKRHFEQYAEVAKALVKLPVSTAQMTDLAKVVFPLPLAPEPPMSPASKEEMEAHAKAEAKYDRAAKKQDEHRATVIGLFEAGKGTEIPGVRGTGWAALHAVTEFVNHQRGNPSEKRPAARLEQAWFGEGHKLNQVALGHLTEMLKAA